MGMATSFVLGELLGVGGMGRVFAATGACGAPLAVKVLAEPFASDAAMLARLRDEADAASRIDHRNVVRVRAQCETDGETQYLVMDRAPGMPLGQLIRQRGALSLTRFRTIALQLLAGVAAIHRAGMVHGDLKSDNVLVDPTQNDRVTIIDFGLAQTVRVAQRSHGSQVLCGTPEYMAPELIRGERTTVASDLYAVGVTLYEMLTGATPFGGDSATVVFDRQLREEAIPPSLRIVDRILPGPFEAVLLRALAKDPAARPHDADMYATALDRVFPVQPFARERDSGFVAVPERASASARTRDFTERHVEHRLARGTGSQRGDDTVGVRRDELATAISHSETPDTIAEAYLALVQALVAAHDLPTAVRELEAAVAWSVRVAVSPSARWPLLLSLAAAYDGTGDHDSAYRMARSARDTANAANSWLGEARANALVRRLDAAHARVRGVTERGPRRASAH